jgi:hypothetical protein
MIDNICQSRTSRSESAQHLSHMWAESAPPRASRTAVDPSTSMTKLSVEQAHQLTNPSPAARRRRKALEHVNDDWCRPTSCQFNALGTNRPIATGGKLRRTGRVSTCSHNVFHLSGLGQRVQVGGPGRGHRCPGCLARSRGVHALSRFERRPRGVAECSSTPATPGEFPRRNNCRSRSQVVRLISLEYLQDHFRTLGGKRSDALEILRAQNNRAGFACHGSIFDQRPRPQLDLRAMIVGRRRSPYTKHRSTMRRFR